MKTETVPSNVDFFVTVNVVVVFRQILLCKRSETSQILCAMHNQEKERRERRDFNLFRSRSFYRTYQKRESLLMMLFDTPAIKQTTGEMLLFFLLLFAFRNWQKMNDESKIEQEEKTFTANQLRIVPMKILLSSSFALFVSLLSNQLTRASASQNIKMTEQKKTH